MPRSGLRALIVAMALALSSGPVSRTAMLCDRQKLSTLVGGTNCAAGAAAPLFGRTPAGSDPAQSLIPQAQAQPGQCRFCLCMLDDHGQVADVALAPCGQHLRDLL